MADQVEAQVTGLTTEGQLTPAFMRLLLFEGVVGTKELRSWLALLDENFRLVRDPDVDNEIDRIARERQALRIEEEHLQAQEEQQEAERLRTEANEQQ